MKLKHILVVLVFALCSSCIVKSLQPFYTSESLEFQDIFLGKWKGKNNATWEVSSIKEHYEAEKADTSKTISEEDIKQFKAYIEGYYLSYIEKDKDDEIENHFIAMPFKVKNEILIDFIPFYLGAVNNSLPQQHLLKTHSVAKLDVLKNKQVKLTWLDQSNLNELYDKKQIKLKREIVGVEEDAILTASSEEIYKFLEKYVTSNIENKWKSDNEYLLDKISDKASTFKVY